MRTKRALSIALAAILLLGMMVTGAYAAGFSNFQSVRTYTSGQFADVASDAWYAADVKQAYEFGLVDGKSATVFDPGGQMTVGEAVKLAACLHSQYTSGTIDFATDVTPWYQPYVDYAWENDILTGTWSDYTKVATRAEFAIIFAAALPDEALTAINSVDDNAIADVGMSATYSAPVYKLYRAGILIGTDSKGTFQASNAFSRGEMVAMVARMADPALRKSITLTAPTVLDAETIFERCSPAVFYIEVYNSNGVAYGTGSGFFLNSDGLAVTNYHVIEGAASAKIRTTDGTYYDVAGTYDYSETNDLALLKINGSGFSYLTAGDSTSVKSGATIYTIGSPLGLENTISNGIISSPSRVVDGTEYIQITAPISSGSSGGALINTYGEVIGVTTGSYYEGQNLNVAVPIHLTNELSRTTVTALKDSVAHTIDPNTTYYTGQYSMVPDFGAYGGGISPEEVYDDVQDDTGLPMREYWYDVDRLSDDAIDEVFTGYQALLVENGFRYEYWSTDSIPEDSATYLSAVHIRTSDNIWVYFEYWIIDGRDYIAVVILL